MNLAEHHASSERLVTNVPLTPREGHDRYTPRFTLCKVGPIDLRAGDYVRTTIAGQFDNENSEAGDHWRHQFVKSVSLPWVRPRRLRVEYGLVDLDPRWSLWVGWNVGAWRMSVSPPSRLLLPGAQMLRERGANWDNWRHHEPWCFSEANEVATDAPGSHFYSAAWFDTNPDYRLPDSYIEITDRNRIEVEVYR